MAAVSFCLTLLITVQGAQLRAPSDVGGVKGAKHPCVVVMRETQAACKGNAYGSSDDKCNFALCYSADLNRDRCADVVTTGAPKNVNFPDDLEKLIKFHDVKCDGGEQKGEGIRNARFDCGKVDEDGLWDKEFLQTFAGEYPVSAETSGVQACILPVKK
eukprot:gnl/MRDRNA2_/MRDRNA2_89452_c0_seq1.p2 gnl/MRDRNA2_/MRDRNA2_89452_c0~~gnl/MRDRNA2_/MRDRNA2_89452_c0_seq1.p2  ORF type:complete len:159 (+),score=40.95 gnl/MRDRNA2_/MRDRNA2_89452_c0_seq1:78-554(+)